MINPEIAQAILMKASIFDPRHQQGDKATLLAWAEALDEKVTVSFGLQAVTVHYSAPIDGCLVQPVKLTPGHVNHTASRLLVEERAAARKAWADRNGIAEIEIGYKIADHKAGYHRELFDQQCPMCSKELVA